MRFRKALLFSFFVVSVSLSAWSQLPKLTARQVVERIQSHVGVPWQKDTVDTFKAGNPDTPITGIAVTMMATLDVLQRAAASGHNLVITHEPTFYSHLDTVDELPEKEADPVLAAKRAFIASHDLVIWRFHDHWHERRPDGIMAGMVHALGWERVQDPKQPDLFHLKPTTVQALAAYLRDKLAIRGPLRVVGDPNMTVSTVALSPGAAGFAHEAGVLERPDVEVLITGESREWETVEYVADAATEGRKKALIMLGHIPSEQAGMEECAAWLREFVKEVPVDFVPAAEAFQSEPAGVPNK